jgi:hypothetical protein
MANTFLTPSIIARESLMLLESTLVGTQLMSRRYQPEFTGNEKRGDTITIRRRDGAPVEDYNGTTVTKNELTETGVTLVLEKHSDATIKVTSTDMTLEIQDFSEQVLEPTILNMREEGRSAPLSAWGDGAEVPGLGRSRVHAAVGGRAAG